VKTEEDLINKSALRQQAEKRLKEKHKADEDLSRLTPHELRTLAHELGVHQIELEMQNEQLREAQEELQKARDKYCDLFDFAPVGYFTISEKGTIQEVNLTGASMLEVERGLLIGQPFTHFIAKGDQDVFYLHRQRVLEAETQQSCELRLVKKEGHEFFVHLDCIVMESSDADFKNIRTAIIDITERKQAEAAREELQSELLQAQKMKSIGTLAGGIAHEVNNLLEVIVGNTELAMDDVPEGNPAQHNLKEVRKACLRAREVVRKILTFSRRTEVALKPTKIGPVITESIKLLRSSIPATIDLHVHVRAASDTVLADATQINQILINLCMNSARAMVEKGGILEVRLEDLELDEDAVKKYENLEPGKYVLLTVSDTGPGIAPDLISRIFEPYFTTKGLSEGAGMGLAVVLGIVKNHGGAVSVQSEPGKGTTFGVILPETQEQAAPEDLRSDDVPVGTERILFIDDEQALANMGRQMLERLGYDVVAKTGSIEALTLLKTQPDRFDLVITDVTMPGMTGDRLTQELMRIRPDIPVILCTEYSERVSKENAEAMGIRAYVMKPFVKKDLAAKVREVLDKKK